MDAPPALPDLGDLCNQTLQGVFEDMWMVGGEAEEEDQEEDSKEDQAGGVQDGRAAVQPPGHTEGKVQEEQLDGVEGLPTTGWCSRCSFSC